MLDGGGRVGPYISVYAVYMVTILWYGMVGGGVQEEQWQGADKDTKTPLLPPNPLSDQCSLYCNICASHPQSHSASKITNKDHSRLLHPLEVGPLRHIFILHLLL